MLTSVKNTFLKSSLRSDHLYAYIAKKVLCKILKATYIQSNAQGKDKKRREDIPTCGIKLVQFLIFSCMEKFTIHST